MRDEEQNRGVERRVVDRQLLELAAAQLDVLVRSQAFARRGEHRARFVDGDNAPNTRGNRLGNVPGPTSEVTNDPPVVEQFEEREEVGSLSDELSSHAVPNG